MKYLIDKIMNLLFIAVPKCAGTSTVHYLNIKIGMVIYLSVNCDKTSPNHISKFKNTGHCCFSHADLNVLLEENIISKKYYDDSFKFCFVRNPWDRVVSLFFFQNLDKKWKFKDFIIRTS